MVRKSTLYTGVCFYTPKRGEHPPYNFSVLGVCFSLTLCSLLGDLIHSPTTTICQQRPSFYISTSLPTSSRSDFPNGLKIPPPSMSYSSECFQNQALSSPSQPYSISLLLSEGTFTAAINGRLWCQTSPCSDSLVVQGWASLSLDFYFSEKAHVTPQSCHKDEIT